MTRVMAAAAAAGVALEINAQVDRLDLDDLHARRARAAGARLVISSDAHSAAAFGALRGGVNVGRPARLAADDLLKTRSVDDHRRSMRRHRFRPQINTDEHRQAQR